MKRLIKSTILLMLVAIVLSACTSKKLPEAKIDLAENTSSVLDNFSDMMSVDDVLEDIGDIDLYQKMDTTNLTSTLEKDDESSTAKKLYYNESKELVYVVYEGYGEDMFECYTKSNSGRDIKACFVDNHDDTNEPERYSVSLESDCYNVGFTDLDKNDRYKADDVSVAIFEKADNDLARSVTYSLENDRFFVSEACYYSEDGYHRYTAYEENDKIYEDDYVKFAKVENAKVNDDLTKLTNDYRVKSVELLAGKHRLQYTVNSSGEKTWYVACDIYLVFSDRNKAISFEDKYGYEASRCDFDEDYWIVTLDNTAIPVDNSSEWFFDFANTEFDDYSIAKIKLTKAGKLKGLDFSKSMLTYY